MISHEDNRPDARAVEKPQQIFLSGLLISLPVQHSADTALLDLSDTKQASAKVLLRLLQVSYCCHVDCTVGDRY